MRDSGVRRKHSHRISEADLPSTDDGYLALICITFWGLLMMDGTEMGWERGWVQVGSRHF